MAAWRERADTLVAAAARMTERRFDALRFDGPGHRPRGRPAAELVVAWPRGSRPIDGIEHMPNLPTEEVFTTPDPARVDGNVRSTKPLYLAGKIIRGLEVRFEGGRAVQIDAERERATSCARYTQRDEGAARLGEVALVDREGRIGPLDTVFFDTLLDENAASHIALGSAYMFTVDDEAEHRAGERRARSTSTS